MIAYTDFLTAVAEGLTLKYSNDGKTVEVKPQVVTRIRAEDTYTGLSIVDKTTDDPSIAPCIDLTRQYTDYIAGETDLDAIVTDLYAHLIATPLPSIDFDQLKDYEAIKPKLLLQLIDADDIKDYIPHVPFGDGLALICRIALTPDATAVVTKGMLDKFDISVDDLFADAMTASTSHRKPVLRSMGETIGMLMDEDDLDDEEQDALQAVPPLYVATMESEDGSFGNYGASAITYPGFLKTATERIGSSKLIVLPSSVHEMLLITADCGVDTDDMRDMVRTINQTQVAPQDRLSDNVYLYDAKSDTLTKV